MKTPPFFATESALCAAFMAWARQQGWVPYAETDGWDILLVHPDGTQIGVQAKLKFNMKVLSQAVEQGWVWSDSGPDFRAVLVPFGEGQRDLTEALGLGLFQPYYRDRGDKFEPDIDETARTYRRWHYANPKSRCPLPEYVPDVIAGSSAPMQLTRWKIAALKIAALIELRGWVCRKDFQELGIDHRRWTQHWLQPMTQPAGAWRFTAQSEGDFRANHPQVYPQVLADVRQKLAARGDLVEQAQV
jgi:hypothetical protein